MFKNIIFILLICCAIVVSTTKDWRMFGGDNAENGEFPYVVSLEMFNTHNCAGAILDDTWVLTVAHCIYDMGNTDYLVVAGSVALESGVRYPTSSYKIHPSYRPDTLENDIALVELGTPIVFDENTGPIEVESKQIPGGTLCTVCGWGDVTNTNISYQAVLQKLDLQVIFNSECSDYYPIETSNICTKTSNNQGNCYGDSGNPLVANGKLIGVASKTTNCGNASADVYTRVSDYTDWINSTMNGTYQYQYTNVASKILTI